MKLPKLLHGSMTPEVIAVIQISIVVMIAFLVNLAAGTVTPSVLGESLGIVILVSLIMSRVVACMYNGGCLRSSQLLTFAYVILLVLYLVLQIRSPHTLLPGS